MRVMNGAGELLDQRGRLLRRFGCGPQPIAQTWSRDEFQRQKGLALELADLQDLHDAGMMKTCGHLGLAAKTLAGGRIRKDDSAQQLQSDAAITRLMDSLVNYSHAAAAHLADDAIFAESLRGWVLRDRRSRELPGDFFYDGGEVGKPQFVFGNPRVVAGL